MDPILERTTFATSRLLEFFTEPELTMQIGHARPLWAAALLKELIDNGLDACEKAGIVPHVRVTVEDDALTVQDNGPGLPADTLQRSVDYDVRISDKTYYVSPTRGRLGNALKCIWAAPFVVDGRHGRIEVASGGLTHTIDVSLDGIEQKPNLAVTQEPSVVKTGTFFRLHWPGVASFLNDVETRDSYNALRLLRAYATSNPHAAFEFQSGDASWERRPADGPWHKWRPDWPTSAHWYTRAAFASLITAYLAEERRTGRARSVREFVAEFDGLSGSHKQKQVLEQAGLAKARLHELLDGTDVNAAVAGRLLQVMQQSTRAIKPCRLGVLGEQHLRQSLVQHYGARPAMVRYRRKVGLDDGVPFVLEAAFAIKAPERPEESRDLIVGLNWSPAVAQPLAQLDGVLAEARVDRWDPVIMVVHLAYPRLEATDRGKGHYRLRGQVLAALETCVRSTTQDWKKLKRRADRENRLAERDVEAECARHERGRRSQLKDAAYAVMEQAYLQASDPGPYGAPGQRLPAEARQIMYAARPLVMERTGGDVWKNSDSFTQRLLPDFIEQHPRRTAGWDVVFGARGALEEPHTGRRVPLGTVAVRNYIAGWRHDVPEKIEPIRVGGLCPTSGPSHRFRFALFVEKQGFDALLEAGSIAARYDLAVMSTKGMSVTAARRLVEELSARDVTILVLRDFDKSGFSIVHTLRSDTRRYQFRSPPRVIDLGLRLKDALAMGLQSEPVQYKSQKDPRERLGECGATDAECQYLVSGGGPGHWWGERVELNAMTALQFLQFLERKLLRAGVRKVAPDADELTKAYRRMWRLQNVQDAVDAVLAQSPADVNIPTNLSRQLRRKLKNSPLSWDTALQEIVQEQRQ